MEDDIKIKMEETGGMRIKQTPGEIKPPLDEEQIKEQAEEEPVGKRITGKIPLSPAIVKPPLRLEGTVLSEITGFPGWMYTEEDLDDIASLILECGWELTPQIQIIVALAGLHGAKVAAYLHWKRTGKPGDLRKERGSGEQKTGERKGEEVKT